jgi:hypothetical protein
MTSRQPEPGHSGTVDMIHRIKNELGAGRMAQWLLLQRTGISLQHPQGGSHALVIPAPEDIFPAPVGTAHMWYTDKNAGKISIHLMKKKSKK